MRLPQPSHTCPPVGGSFNILYDADDIITSPVGPLLGQLYDRLGLPMEESVYPVTALPGTAIPRQGGGCSPQLEGADPRGSHTDLGFLGFGFRVLGFWVFGLCVFFPHPQPPPHPHRGAHLLPFWGGHRHTRREMRSKRCRSGAGRGGREVTSTRFSCCRYAVL